MNIYETDKSWRELSSSDTIQTGDRFYSWSRDESVLRDYIGKHGACCGKWYRRVAPQDNWISFKDREPTKEDANEFGKIVARYKSGDYHFVAWNGINHFEYWMPLNFTPREPARIKVDGNEVIPNKDGSLTVGCQTIKSEDFEEIA